MAANGLFTNEVHINAITGLQGRVKPSSTSHFSWRNNNISVYKTFEHQHLKEITQSITIIATPFGNSNKFYSCKGNFARGIFVLYTSDCSLSLEEAKALYKTITKMLRLRFVTDTNPDLKEVVKHKQVYRIS